MTADAAAASETAAVAAVPPAAARFSALQALTHAALGLKVVVGYDATRVNIPHLPHGAQVAGYSTGSPDICWRRQDFAAWPGSLWIDQDAAASDFTADYLDVEGGAATIAESPRWYRMALGDYHAGTRPGQRWPGFYLSASNVTSLVNTLIAAGIRSGPRLIVANWNLSEPQAVAEVLAASGPFPVVGVQFADPGPYDLDAWSEDWLHAVSGKPTPPPPPGPFVHHTVGAETFVALAAVRHTSVEHLLTTSLRAYKPADWAVLAKGLSHLNAVEVQKLAAAIGHIGLPPGTPWYSTSP